MPVVYPGNVVKIGMLDEGAAVSDHDHVRLRPHLPRACWICTYMENIMRFKIVNVLKLVMPRVRRAGLKNLKMLPDIVVPVFAGMGEGSPTRS